MDLLTFFKREKHTSEGIEKAADQFCKELADRAIRLHKEADAAKVAFFESGLEVETLVVLVYDDKTGRVIGSTEEHYGPGADLLEASDHTYGMASEADTDAEYWNARPLFFQILNAEDPVKAYSGCFKALDLRGEILAPVH